MPLGRRLGLRGSVLGGARTGVSGESRNDEDKCGYVSARGGDEAKFAGIALAASSEGDVKGLSGEVGESDGAVGE